MHTENSVLDTLQLSGCFTTMLVVVGILLIPVIVLCGMAMRHKGTKPTLTYKKSEMIEFVRQSCTLLNKSFRAPVWARSGHIQTLLGSFINHVNFKFRREYVPMKDGGEVALDWGDCDSELNQDCPLLIALPGLTGDAKDVAFLCKHAASQGFRPVVFNKRGHGGSRLATPKLQSFGDPSDLREAIVHVRSKFPGKQLVAVGVSAGSALLSSYLAEYCSSDSYIVAGVAISPGHNAQKLFSGKVIHPLYAKALLFKLQRLLKSHSTILKKVIDVDAALNCKTIAAFEELVYCKLYKFKDMDQYWEHNEPLKNYKNISTPMLCISALDDPVCRKEMIEYHLFEQVPDMMLATTECGGHCGFIEAGSLKPWAERLAVEYLISVLQFNREKSKNAIVPEDDRCQNLNH